jgi:hypothetical protein
MPSFDHEILVDLFRENGQLAPELLRRCAGIAVDHVRVELESIDLTRVAPTAYYADAVAVLRDRDNRPVTGVIVEVQLRTDENKLLSWPVYVTTLRAKLDCAAMLLVIAPNPAVAAWARQPIELGHPGFRLTPVVIEFKDVPWVRDRAAASRLPELAMLSVMAHPELEVAEVAVEAISQLPEDRRQLYLDVILMALPAAVRRILEARMQGYEYQSDFARKYYGQGRKEGRQEGRKEGRQEGRKEGRQEGRKEGRQEGLRAAVVALARTKLGELSDDDLAAIEAVSDQRVLTELVTSLGQARSIRKARAALDRALGR